MYSRTKYLDSYLFPSAVINLMKYQTLKRRWQELLS
jgi:hypothetical protein